MQYAHGEFIITRCSDAMLTQAYGPWNRECVNSFASEYRTLSESLHGKAWCDIVSVVGESLLIPDAEALLHERVASVNPIGLTHVALVMGESSVRATTQAQLKRVYRDTNIDYIFVDSIEDAVDWLSSKGFSVDKDGIDLHREKVAMKL
ncbi:MAG: hypothetical protein VXW48_09355 [Pseudomonadota bacterium]|nr:hypothetical protein [Pseudomonadota bacterium]